MTQSPALPEPALHALSSIVGRTNVVTDPDICAAFATDWTGRFSGATPAVVRPASTEELAAVIGWCAEEQVALCVQGGNTGLSGGAVPLRGEVVLQTTHFRSAPDVDTLAGQCTVGAGTALVTLQRAAAEAGWTYGVDLSSRDTATVGGTVATNAGGLRVVRHGTTRAQLLGVEAVLGTGAVVSDLRGLVKDATGYHLAGLLCGSEGTLGVVTAVRVRLVPRATHRATAMLAFATVGDAVAAATLLRRSLPSLEAAELLIEEGLTLVCGAFHLSPPFAEPHRAYLLVEAADVADPGDALAACVESVAGVRAVAVATDPARQQALWRYREAQSEAIATQGVPHKLDVSLPAATLAEFAERVAAAVAGVAPSARTWLFGHVGDGNVHVNVTGVPPEEDDVDDAVCDLAVALGGSISGEHGIGVAKRRLLERYRSASELATFRALRQAMDPAGILNPEVLVAAR